MSVPVPLLTLRFQELATQIQSAPKADLAVSLLLPISADTLARDVLRHTPPRPLEIEQAIELVEDAVMPARAHLPDAFGLQVEDALLREMAGDDAPDEPSVAASGWLSIQAVEDLFSRLVALSEGRPVTQDALPTDAAHAARLVIVREILHHWGLGGLVLA